MSSTEGRLKGVVAGAALIYYLDPDRGARGRRKLRDRLLQLNRKLEGGLDATARDARNRSRGLSARAGQRLRSDDAPAALIERESVQ